MKHICPHRHIHHVEHTTLYRYKPGRKKARHTHGDSVDVAANTKVSYICPALLKVVFISKGCGCVGYTLFDFTSPKHKVSRETQSGSTFQTVREYSSHSCLNN